ncbi:MAG TPA: ATP-binding protein, partial [Candidatus Eisenbacteria bacterium]
QRVAEGLALAEVARESPGHGLSLVIARAIVRAHEGVLTAENLDSGGARFTLQLPVAEDSGHVVAEDLRLGAEAPDRR